MSNVVFSSCDVPYTALPNELILDKTISSDAVRIWCYIQVRCNGMEWDVHPHDVQRSLGIAVNRWKTASKELVDAGWMKRERFSESNGHFRWKYILTMRGSATSGSTTSGPASHIEIKDSKKLKNLDILTSAMDEISDRDGKDIELPKACWRDLQLDGVVRISTRQDQIDAQALIDAHGYDNVLQACQEAREGTLAPYLSKVASVLEPTKQGRRELLNALRRKIRDHWKLTKFVSNDLLDTIIVSGKGWVHQFKACRQHHGEVTKEWIEESIKDKTIVFDTDRTDEQLRSMLEKAQ